MCKRVSLAMVTLMVMLLLTGCFASPGNTNLKEAIDTLVTAVKTDETTSAANAADAADNGGSVFSPKDVSDETIRSIKTYDDYMAMYKAIIDDYLANYEAKIKGTVLYSEETFADMKKQYDDAFKEQKGLYGAMGKATIISKDSLVDFLIQYRDTLQETVDSLAGTLG